MQPVMALARRLWQGNTGRIAVAKSVAKRSKHRGKSIPRDGGRKGGPNGGPQGGPQGGPRGSTRDAARPAHHQPARGAVGKLPDTVVVQVTGTDRDGDALARPVAW